MERIGAIVVRCLDSGFVYFGIAASTVYTAEYVQNCKVRREIKQVLREVLEREREQVLQGEGAAAEQVLRREGSSEGVGECCSNE